MLKCQFPKILVKGRKNPLLAHCALQNVAVLASWSVGTNPGHVMSQAADGFDCIKRNVLVGQEIQMPAQATWKL